MSCAGCLVSAANSTPTKESSNRHPWVEARVALLDEVNDDMQGNGIRLG
jgi:hypothetical protein